MAEKTNGKKALKKKKSFGFIKWILVAVLLLAAGVGGYFIYDAVNAEDEPDYAEDIFYQACVDGKLARMKWSDFRNDDFDYADYYVYMYNFEADKEILNFDDETCAADEKCADLKEQNQKVLDILVKAAQAGKHVFIMDGADLDENATGIAGFTENLPFITKIEGYSTIKWEYVVGTDITINNLTIMMLDA